MFIQSQYVNQYKCAIENKFTHYGFTTIKNGKRVNAYNKYI